MLQRTLDNEDNSINFDEIDILDPEMQLTFLDGIESGSIQTTQDVRKWVAETLPNADMIRVRHGIVERTRNRLQGIGQRAREYPIDRISIQNEIAAREAQLVKIERRRQKAEVRKKLMSERAHTLMPECGSEFLQSHTAFVNMVIGGRFSDITDSGDALILTVKQAKADFLAIRPDGRAIFSGYMIQIMRNAVEKYGNKTLSAENAYHYINSIVLAGGRGITAAAMELGDKLMNIAQERGEDNAILDCDFFYNACIAKLRPARKPRLQGPRPNISAAA